MLIRSYLSKYTYFLVVLSVCLLTSCDFLSRRILVKPVVQVENIKLSAQEFSKILAQELKDLDALSAKDPQIVGQTKQKIINEFIVASLVDLWLAELDLSVADADLASATELVRNQYPTDSSFKESLAASGKTFLEWRSELAASLKRKLVFKKLAETSLEPTETELKSFYDSNLSLFEQTEAIYLSQIMVKDANEAEIIKRLVKKTSFNEIARQYSFAFNAHSKDVFGWVEPGIFPELEPAFKMPVGRIIGPLSFSDGIRFFKILDKRPKKILPFESVKYRVLAGVRSSRETALFKSWLDVQIKRYTIKKNQSVLDSLRVETQL